MGEETEKSDANAPAGPQAKVAAEKKQAAAKAAPSSEDRQAEGVFTRERLLGPDGGQITGQAPHIIVGALTLTDAEDFTRTEIAELVDEFHEREIPSEAD